MINIKNIERRSTYLVYIIKNRVKVVKYPEEEEPRYAYWTLYLDDDRDIPREIDTCATSYCISVLEAEKNRLLAIGSSDKYLNHDTIQQAVRTLIKLRSKNGAWPSVINPKCLLDSAPVPFNDVAIGDNFYALTALLDVGFLTKQFVYTNNIPKELLCIDGRIKYVCETIDWLLANRVLKDKDNIGWYYTNTRDDKNCVPVTLATANVLYILNRIKNAIKMNKSFSSYNTKIDETIKQTNDFFIMHIKSDHGIGKVIQSQSPQSSLLHTCKMVDALILSEDPNLSDEISNAIDYIILSCQSLLNNDFKDIDISFYTDNYKLLLPSGEIKISHENYIEGVLLYTLLNILIQNNQSGSYVSSKIKINKTDIEQVVNSLIKRLVNFQTKEGDYNGLFMCHVSRNEGMYPVYASFEGYRAYRMYMSLSKPEIHGYKFDPNAPYIFISYSHFDESIVFQDVERLKKQYNCWIDKENLDGGRCKTEDDWTQKVEPVLRNHNCKGVIMYVSQKAFLSNGILKEAEWIQKNNINFYTFLIGFSHTITPNDMAQILDELKGDNPKLNLRRKQVFSYIVQTDKDETEFSYYHRHENFSHLSEDDFLNWLRKIL